jgi:hypothetical protein
MKDAYPLNLELVKEQGKSKEKSIEIEKIQNGTVLYCYSQI